MQPSFIKELILEKLKKWEVKGCPNASWSRSEFDPEEREVANKWFRLTSEKSSWGKGGRGKFYKTLEKEELKRLKPMVKRFYSPNVNVWIELSGEMILIDDNTTEWERKEFYKDEKCYRIEDLKTQPELLVDILSRAIHNLAENTVNEIL